MTYLKENGKCAWRLAHSGQNGHNADKRKHWLVFVDQYEVLDVLFLHALGFERPFLGLVLLLHLVVRFSNFRSHRGGRPHLKCLGKVVKGLGMGRLWRGPKQEFGCIPFQ